MTYVPKPGELVRVLEVMPEDQTPKHKVGDIATADVICTFESRDYPGWLLLNSDTYCRVEPADVRTTVTGPAESCAFPLLGTYMDATEPEDAPPPRVAVAATVRVRAYDVIATAIEHACEAGVHRAYKHTDAPSREAIAAACADAVKLALCDVLDFGDET